MTRKMPPRTSNPVVVDGETARMTATNGHTILVDAADLELVSSYRWNARKLGKSRYAIMTTKPSLLMHNLLMGRREIDHKNGDGLDNRRSNLRPVTRRQNCHNRQSRPHSSPYKGVSWHREHKKWYAQVHGPDGKRRFLGYFTSDAEAGRAYDAAARELQGQFAALNFPLPGERPAVHAAASKEPYDR